MSTSTSSVEKFICQVCCREFRVAQVGASSKLPPSLITVETAPPSSNSASSNATDNAANKKPRTKNNICGACKKFYSRSKASNASIFTEKCSCPEVRIMPNPSTDRNPDGRARKLSSKQLCRSCRARRCHSAMMDSKNSNGAGNNNNDSDDNNDDSMNDDVTAPTPTPAGVININTTTGPPVSQDDSSNQVASTPVPQQASSSSTVESTNRINVRMIPCEICGVSSSGYHFGVISCEGCKGFFRRSISKKTPYKCKLVGKPGAKDEDRATREHQMKCKKCRFDACIAAGMSLSAVQTGRHSMQRKIETSAYVKKLAAENRLLSTPIMRGARIGGRLTIKAEGAGESLSAKIEPQSVAVKEENEDNSQPEPLPSNEGDQCGTPSSGTSKSTSSSEADDDEQITVDDDGEDFSPRSFSLSISQPPSIATLSPSMVAAALGTPTSNRSAFSIVDSSPGSNAGEGSGLPGKRLKLEAPASNAITNSSASDIELADLITPQKTGSNISSTPLPAPPAPASSMSTALTTPFLSNTTSDNNNNNSSITQTSNYRFSGQFASSLATSCFTFTSPNHQSVTGGGDFGQPGSSTSASSGPFLCFSQGFLNNSGDAPSSSNSKNQQTPQQQSSSGASGVGAPGGNSRLPPTGYGTIPIHIGMPTPYAVQSIHMESVQAVAQRLLDSNVYLTRINQIPELRLTFDMDPLLAWTDVMNALFDQFVTSISQFVRLLPGFRELCQSDRVVLFTQAYFPILLAQLSLRYDMNSRTPNFFCETTPEAREMLKFLLCGSGDFVERQMNDAGFTIATWQPNTLEFSLFCGLLFFDPDVPELNEREKVRQISEAYKMADETFNSQRDGQAAQQQPSQSTQLQLATPRFSSLFRYFKPMYQILGFVMKSIENERPDFVNIHPLWSEMHKYLTRKLATSDVLNIDSNLPPSFQQTYKIQ